MLLSVALWKCHTGAVNSYTGKQITTGPDALHVDFQKIKKQSHKTLVSSVLALTFFKELILLTLNDKLALQFLSNMSRNNNCFFFFPLILWRQ